MTTKESPGFIRGENVNSKKYYRGKRIRQIERMLGKSMKSICLEATAFNTLDEYVSCIIDKHNLTSRNKEAFKRAIKRMTIEFYGYEFYRENMTMGGYYLRAARKYLGVTDVLNHLRLNKIDLWVFSNILFPREARKAYSWFYNYYRRAARKSPNLSRE